MSPDLVHADGAAVRRRARSRDWTGPTPGLALGYVQANLVVVPRTRVRFLPSATAIEAVPAADDGGGGPSPPRPGI